MTLTFVQLPAPFMLARLRSSTTSALLDGEVHTFPFILAHRDQYAVFDQPHASDPTHSLLAKDHFGVILNEPAGELAKVHQVAELG